MFLLRLLIVVGLTIVLFTYHRPPPPPPPSAEAFTVPPPIVSIPLDPKAHSANISIYELDNYAYEQALRKTFAEKQKDCPNVTDIKAWALGPLEPVPPAIKALYDIALPYLETTITSSPHFDIPADTQKFNKDDADRVPVPINIYSPRLVSYRTNSKKDTLLQIELVLHRESKYQAKHVEFWVHIGNNSKRPSVVVANVAGILFEDALSNLTEIHADAPYVTAHDIDMKLPSDYPATKATNEFMPQWPPIAATCPYTG